MTDDAAAGPVVEDEELDGLSGERTDLAWSRSGLAFIVCLAAIAKRSLPQISTLDARAIVVVALVVGGIAWGFALVWARAVAGATLTGRRIGDARKLHWISIGTAVIGVVAVVVALFPDR